MRKLALHVVFLHFRVLYPCTLAYILELANEESRSLYTVKLIVSVILTQPVFAIKVMFLKFLTPSSFKLSILLLCWAAGYSSDVVAMRCNLWQVQLLDLDFTFDLYWICLQSSRRTWPFSSVLALQTRLMPNIHLFMACEAVNASVLEHWHVITTSSVRSAYPAWALWYWHWL